MADEWLRHCFKYGWRDIAWAGAHEQTRRRLESSERLHGRRLKGWLDAGNDFESPGFESVSPSGERGRPANSVRR